MDPSSRRKKGRRVRTVMSESSLCLGLLSGTNRCCLSHGQCHGILYESTSKGAISYSPLPSLPPPGCRVLL